ncbi:hypothetical protein HL658_36250 [Azospirillum sp. RWY-5-1]|uniref:Helix-turn-helix domain-containing protein n=1 Tax=Azospirillum oleiclasticum TaxID=2735135 RepID=A0ABX2TN52_9PROT|nr:hypothetical protein [Azospirillum oleiclasticum]NYZ18020.1 hypothetical protein [Azospirillum oleiclasticum]NYZ25178.1 hypothetical protein [Azospirillum oleiclasticum]
MFNLAFARMPPPHAPRRTDHHESPGTEWIDDHPALLQALRDAHARGWSPHALARWLARDLRGSRLPRATTEDVARWLGVELTVIDRTTPPPGTGQGS